MYKRISNYRNYEALLCYSQGFMIDTVKNRTDKQVFRVTDAACVKMEDMWKTDCSKLIYPCSHKLCPSFILCFQTHNNASTYGCSLFC